VIDLIFLYTKAEEFNNYYISPNLRSSSDHVSLLVLIIIKEEFIQEKKQTIENKLLLRIVKKKRKLSKNLETR